MGDRKVDQGALFYEFSLERHVPMDHMLRSIDRKADAFYRPPTLMRPPSGSSISVKGDP